MKLLFEVVYKCGFPDYWKQAIISPIHKKGKSDSVMNYRLVSLLCVTSKVMEKYINTALMEYIEDNGLLSARQGAYRTDTPQHFN